MKQLIFYIYILFAVVICCSSCEKKNEILGVSVQDTIKTYSLNTAKAVDMVLIYKGGVQRPDWTADEFKPYITYKNPETNIEDWLYDGFLFLEITDGAGRSFTAPTSPGPDSKSARKVEWESMLNAQFASNKGVDALNKAITQKVAEIGVPKRKRKVVIGIPEPWPGQLDWGVLNGTALNFNSQNDRLNSIKWYVDEILKKWTALNPANLELAGFYWITENAYTSQVMLPIFKSYIVTKGKYTFYHIPYWGASMRDNWTKMGFDISYQQPNVYFHVTRTNSVKETISYAKEKGHTLEFEFDENVMKSRGLPNKREIFLEYFNEFEANGIFENYPLTYYQLQFGWATLVRSTEPEDLELSKKLGVTIVKRQKKADALIK
jgi:hypothetical protein